MSLSEYFLVGARRFVPEQPITQPHYTGFRCLFGAEGGRITPDAMPCVVPSLNIAGIEFTRDLQLMSFELMKVAAIVTGKNWRAVYGGHRAFTNNNGFDMSGDPRVDYVNGLNIGAPLPKLMKAIICEGNFLRADVIGNELVMTPGIHAIDGNKPLPSVETILRNNWYFVATTANESGGVWHVNNFPQGNGSPVLIPYILKQSARYLKSFFTEWDDAQLPDPLRIYL